MTAQTAHLPLLDPAGSDRIADLGDLRIHYHLFEKAGDAAPPLFFIHGGGPGATGLNDFLFNAPYFIERATCLFYDMPQYGGSSKPVIDGPMWSWNADVILRFMDAIGLEKARFVTQSAGSAAVIKLAADHPERVASLVLMGAQPVMHGVGTPLALATKHGRAILTDYWVADGGPSLEKLAALIRTYELHDDANLDERSLHQRYESSIDPEIVALASVPNWRGQPECLLGDLRKVTAPALIFWGLHDWFGPIDIALLMLNQFADARLHVIRNAAHHLQTECPDEFNAVTGAFLGL